MTVDSTPLEPTVGRISRDDQVIEGPDWYDTSFLERCAEWRRLRFGETPGLNEKQEERRQRRQEKNQRSRRRKQETKRENLQKRQLQLAALLEQTALSQVQLEVESLDGRVSSQALPSPTRNDLVLTSNFASSTTALYILSSSQSIEDSAHIISCDLKCSG